MPSSVAIVVPVGPKQLHARWLAECLESIVAQSDPADFVVIVDDMHGITDEHVEPLSGMDYTIYRPPWLLGVGSAFNHGCAVAFNAGADLALMMGADDALGPQLVAGLRRQYEREGGRAGYYWHDTHYQDGNQQRLPCNNASMTPGFLRTTGGLPVEAAAGGMDAALISAMLVHWPESLIHVDEPGAFVWSRQHPDQERERLRIYDGMNGAVRNVVTNTYAPAAWGRSLP